MLNSEKWSTLIPENILSEMEETEIRGGEEDVHIHVYAVDACKSDNYCAGGNCVAGCGAPPKKDGEDQEDKDVPNP